MNINILITNEHDEPLINETVHDVSEAIAIIEAFDYEYSARMDALTGGEHE